VGVQHPKADAVIAVQIFGDFQNFHPHMHVMTTDGCFYYWMQNHTALDELMGVDFSFLSLDRIYKVSDFSSGLKPSC